MPVQQDLWNFQLRAWTSRLGLPTRANGRGLGWAASMVVRRDSPMGCWRLWDDKAELGGRRARIGRGVIETRGNDSRDDRCGEIFRLMVRLPVLGKGGQRERDGHAYSTDRFVSRWLVCDWPTDRRCGHSSQQITSLDPASLGGRARG